jgi:hypothetical protein
MLFVRDMAKEETMDVGPSRELKILQSYEEEGDGDKGIQSAGRISSQASSH